MNSIFEKIQLIYQHLDSNLRITAREIKIRAFYNTRGKYNFKIKVFYTFNFLQKVLKDNSKFLIQNDFRAGMLKNTFSHTSKIFSNITLLILHRYN